MHAPDFIRGFARHGAVACAVVVWTAGLTGCEMLDPSGGTEMSGPTQELVPAARPLVEDVPVPSAFELVSEHSTSYVDTRTRFIAHEYLGRASVQAVRAFYRDRLVKDGWRWLRDKATFGEDKLIFEHEYVVQATGETVREWCWLYIKPLGHGKTRLRIELTPAPTSGE